MTGRADEVLQYCDSYSRMGTLVDLADELSRDDWHAVLGREWSCCDNIGAYRATLRRLLPTHGPVRPMMTADEQAAYDALPERITVYRGCDTHNMRGASWSLDRDVARRFPFLMRYRAARPLLVTATVLKSRVLALKLDRSETVVITFHARQTRLEALGVEVTAS